MEINDYKDLFLGLFREINLPHASLVIGTCVDDFYPANSHNQNLELVSGQPIDLDVLVEKIAGANVSYEHHFQVAGQGFTRVNLNLAEIKNGSLEKALYSEGEVNPENIIQMLNNGLLQIAVNPERGIYGVPGDAYSTNTDPVHGTGPGFDNPFAIPPQVILGFVLALREYNNNGNVVFVIGKHPDCGLMAHNLQHEKYQQHPKVRALANNLSQHGRDFMNSKYYLEIETPFKECGIGALVELLSGGGGNTTLYVSTPNHRPRKPGALKVSERYINSGR